MLSVWYILSEINLEMNRGIVIEIGLSGLIPVDLEAWINLNFAKLSGWLPLYAIVTSHYKLAAVQLMESYKIYHEGSRTNDQT